MAKDKKAKKAHKGDEAAALKPKKAKGDKKKHADIARPHPLEALSRLADHPLVSELLAAGALAAVAAVAEAGSKSPGAVKSADSAKKAGKAAAAAIGARLLKEFNSGTKAVSDKLPTKK
ncbi:hypothetical protein [Sphingomonas humi]|uniref:Uncharacterized protein n=1 Tax=Sphingomonas humi TaxID=335630 RepID=A0ABP7RW00_9SPHN